MKKFTITALLLVVLILLVSCGKSEEIKEIPDAEADKINNFEECVAAGYPVMESYPEQCATPEGTTFFKETAFDAEEYFFQSMIEEGVVSIGGRPIEGFNPELYMQAFPGLTKEDFDNVEAINGKWSLVNGELNFKTISDEGIFTTADGTINEQGMATLLEKLSRRLAIPSDSKENIDAIITKIKTK